MKIRIDLDIRLDEERVDEHARPRFKRIKRHVKKLGQDKLALLILNAVEADLDRGSKIGFKKDV